MQAELRELAATIKARTRTQLHTAYLIRDALHCLTPE